MISRNTITFQNTPQSLNWRGEDLIDWVGGGSVYSLNGEFTHARRGYSYKFDAAIQSDNGVYAVIYEKLGTKGLLLRNGEILRELNRSFYHAAHYEYPIAFFELANGQYAIAHCPDEYCQIEFEEVESGKKLTQSKGRKPEDCFHSRFRVNSSNSVLLSAGWVWHPYSICELYSIHDCIRDVTILDKGTAFFPMNGEVCSAEFLTDDLVIISSTKEEPLDEEELNDEEQIHPGQIGLFSISQRKLLKKVTVDFDTGTLIPIDENRVIDLYQYPKLIDLNSGEVTQRFKDIDSGKQESSIIHHIDKVPPIAVSANKKKIAIANGNKIEVLEIEQVGKSFE